MNRLSKFSTLAVGVLSLASSPALFAQAAAPAPAAVAPQAIPAKIALIAFESAVFATNEGQKAVLDVQKKYEPSKAKLDAAAAEVDSLQKQLQAATTISDDDRANRVRTIDTKQKALQRDAEDAQASYQQDLQDVYGKIATKVNGVVQKYVVDNGYTLLLDVSGQTSNVLFAVPQSDITRAVIDTYNTSSGVTAPATAPAPRPAAPRTAAPRK